MSAHTTGPWSYFHDTCLACDEKGEKEFVITGPPGAQHGQFSHEPDARLIAAAPELLESLELAIRVIAGVDLRVGEARNRTAIVESLPKLRAVIAKATGTP